MIRTVRVPVFRPLAWQRIAHGAFRRFRDARIFTFLTGRQCGKTTKAVDGHGTQSLATPSGTNLVITPTYSLGEPLYSGLKRWGQPPDQTPLLRYNDSRRVLTWVHGPITDCRTLHPHPGDVVGHTARRLMNVDEAGRVTAEGWGFMNPMLRRWDARQVRTGTPRGKTGGEGGFYHGAMLGLDRNGGSPLITGEPPRDKRYITLRVPCHPNIAPWWTLSAIEDARASMPERLFMQEILALFVEGSSDVFTRRMLRRSCVALPEPVDEDGSYVIAWDPAKTQDYSGLSVGRLDGTQPREVEVQQWTDARGWKEQIPDVVDLSRRWNHAPVIVDASGLGAVIAEWLEDRGVTVIAYVITPGAAASAEALRGEDGTIPKARLIENLVAMMGHEELDLLAPPPDHPGVCTCARCAAYRELLDFSMELNAQRTAAGVITGHTEVKYGHVEGGHDDTVSARALLAWFVRYAGGGGVPLHRLDVRVPTGVEGLATRRF